MNHSEFVTFIRSLLGKVPTMSAREALADMIQKKKFEFRLEWNWMPKGMTTSPDNPLNKVDGVALDFGSCSDTHGTIFVHEDQRT